MTEQLTGQNKCAIITAIYKQQKYSSAPLELLPNSDNIKLIMSLSDSGTSSLNMIKFPTSATSFIIFSKEQLAETLFEIEILDMSPKFTDASKPKKKKTTIIKS